MALGPGVLVGGLREWQALAVSPQKGTRIQSAQGMPGKWWLLLMPAGRDQRGSARRRRARLERKANKGERVLSLRGLALEQKPLCFCSLGLTEEALTDTQCCSCFVRRVLPSRPVVCCSSWVLVAV